MGLEFHYTEGQTPLDEEEKEGLKIKSITTQRELDEFEQLNIEKAVEWTIHANLKQEKILTEKFIKDLETVLKYVNYFFMPLFAPYFVKIFDRSFGYAQKFCLVWHQK